ncbi:MAG: RsbRD N-terminal domain-containing protein [Thermodesulfovibrionales bacterium]|nr:RsbRD N-terminal domain-containing protein [Thermodesulfovibrionales bacterium]
MRLNSLLTDKKASILEKWFNVIIESYPPDTASFLKTQSNRFANPIGSTISKGIEDIFDELLRGLNLPQAEEKTSQFLDDIVRIRAVQDFTPSQALSFIFPLKRIIREELAAEIAGNHLSDEILALESEIDGLALSSFDIYMKCREKIYDIKANEVKRSTFRLLQMANLINDTNGEEPDLAGNINLKIKRGEVKK